MISEDIALTYDYEVEQLAWNFTYRHSLDLIFARLSKLEIIHILHFNFSVYFLICYSIFYMVP